MTLNRTIMEAVRKLRPNKHNARTHPKKQIRQLANAIRQFGWTYPILVDDDFEIICGHARWEAAKELGLTNVPILIMQGLSDAEKFALAIADNKIATNAGWDRSLLASQLGELASLLPEFNLDLEITGFEPAEIDSLVADFGASDQDPADEPTERAVLPISRKADFWLLGHHRMLCGNACEEADMRVLMGRDRANMVFADPPYNVRISPIVGRGKIKHREFASAYGEMSRDEFTRFLARTFSLAAQYSRDGSIHYVCMDWRRRHLGEALDAGGEAYTELKNLVVWAKTNAGQGSFYRSQHEHILVFKNGDGPHQNNIELGRHGRSRSNVWTYVGVNTFRAGRMDELSVHPTVKPVALVADAMRDCSRRGDIILDPFLGSGTTILAAERVGRRGYGLEIDPLYVDVAIRRWQDFTRRDAILMATGQTFDEVTAARAHAKRERSK